MEARWTAVSIRWTSGAPWRATSTWKIATATESWCRWCLSVSHSVCLSVSISVSVSLSLYDFVCVCLLVSVFLHLVSSRIYWALFAWCRRKVLYWFRRRGRSLLRARVATETVAVSRRSAVAPSPTDFGLTPPVSVSDYVAVFTSAKSAQYVEILGQRRTKTSRIPKVTPWIQVVDVTLGGSNTAVFRELAQSDEQWQSPI